METLENGKTSKRFWTHQTNNVHVQKWISHIPRSSIGSLIWLGGVDLLSHSILDRQRNYAIVYGSLPAIDKRRASPNPHFMGDFGRSFSAICSN